MSEIQNVIKQAVDHYWKIAEKHFKREFDKPSVFFTLKGTSAGRAFYMENTLDFNVVLAKDNWQDFVTNTVAHEVAHLINYQQFPGEFFTANGQRHTRIMHHGKGWKHIMMSVFKLDASRCHSYEVDKVQTRKQRRWAYKCSCKTWNIATVTHNRIQKGQKRFCPDCKADVTFLGYQV